MLTLNPTENAEYLLRINQTAPALVYVFNQDVGQNEFTNNKIGSLLGYSEAEVLQMGVDLMTDKLHPADASNVYDHMESLRDLKDGEVRSITYRMRHRDGHWVWLLSQDSVFQRDSEGKVTHHIGTALDITALKECADVPLAMSA